MRIGIDFGTTNSGAAFYDGKEVHAFRLDPSSADPAVLRSAMYITRDHDVFIGHEAIDAYYRENVGRPSRLVRERVGEIEITQSDVGSVKGYPVGPQTYVRDVYVLVDELTPGRLLHSLKSGLATGYEGTVIFGRHYSLDALIAAYLREIRDRIQVETGEIAKDVVMGRPVNFVNSTSEADNQRALARLRSAALKAGFVDIDFEFEPVAAALFYELNLGESQNIVVFDLGGGTLDITVMHVGGDRSRRRVLSTGGVGIAGDSFDQRIINWRILDHFGRGSTWGENGKPFPSQYTAALADWQTVTELLQPETLHFLRIAQLTSSHPKQIRALESLLINNYAVRLFDEVERAKIALSSQMFEVIQLQGDDIDLWQPITRSQFEAIIVNETRVIESCLLDTMERSGLQRDEIDAVVRTGGSAQIPRFIDLLGRIFGAEKVVHTDMFGGVAAGLAIRARQETE